MRERALTNPPVAPRTHRPGAALGIIFLVAGLLGCETVDVTEVEVGVVEVSPESRTLFPGETATFTASVEDGAGNVLTGRSVHWTSSDPDVAGVDSEGVVVAHAEGVARIEAAADGISGAAEVTVDAWPDIVLDPTEVEFEGTTGQGPSGEHIVEVTNGGGGELSGLEVDVEFENGGASQWLEAHLEQPSAPTVLTLTATAVDVGPGTHHANVIVQSSTLEGTPPRMVHASFHVGPGSPVLALDPEAVEFSVPRDQPTPDSAQVSVQNLGTGVLSGLQVEITHPDGEPAGWLGAELDSSEAPAEVTLEVDAVALPVGTYGATVSVLSDVAENSPQVVEVVLEVTAGLASAPRKPRPAPGAANHRPGGAP